MFVWDLLGFVSCFQLLPMSCPILLPASPQCTACVGLRWWHSIAGLSSEGAGVLGSGACALGLGRRDCCCSVLRRKQIQLVSASVVRMPPE